MISWPGNETRLQCSRCTKQGDVRSSWFYNWVKDIPGPLPDRRARCCHPLHQESKENIQWQERRRGIRQPGGRQSPHVDGDPRSASRSGHFVHHHPRDLVFASSDATWLVGKTINYRNLRELFFGNPVKLSDPHTRHHSEVESIVGLIEFLDMESKIVLDRYIISDVRSEADGGSVAGTFEAEEISTGKKVIVELMPAASLRDSVRGRLEAEALAAKKINHINIPRLYEFGFENDQFVYVTEHFDGITFEEWVREHGAMPVEAVLRVALQIVNGLGTAAFYKIFHHAINPSNLVIVPGRTLEGDWPLVKIIHFLGVAPTFSAAEVSTARFDNSAPFASPEQLEKGTVDFRSEMFSLGCTLWFLLTGAAPFALPGDPAEGSPARMGLAVERLSEIPKQLRRLLGQMLATNPDERPLDPIALEAEIRKCLTDGEQLETTSQGIAVAPLSEARRWRRQFGGACPRKCWHWQRCY